MTGENLSEIQDREMYSLTCYLAVGNIYKRLERVMQRASWNEYDTGVIILVMLNSYLLL